MSKTYLPYDPGQQLLLPAALQEMSCRHGGCPPLWPYFQFGRLLAYFISDMWWHQLDSGVVRTTTHQASPQLEFPSSAAG